MKNTPLMKIVEEDEWLIPVAEEVKKRFDHFDYRLKSIVKDFESLDKFSSAYKYFGINYSDQEKGWWYREWAPRAEALFLTGDFNKWERFTHPMKKNKFGVWEIFISDAEYQDTFTHQSKVKVVVIGENGIKMRIPAYIKRVVQDDDTKNYSGQVWKDQNFAWTDHDFISRKDQLLIYECHIGMAQEKEGVGTYAEFEEKILPYIKDLGYNTIQMMAIQEHPYYGSFGYHVSNFFAPSSRFGTPEELKSLINTAHKLGLNVIMDIVHSHSVKNILEGINEFDGSPDLYFHAGERGNHPEWDSKIFDYGKTEVLRFLLSNIKYWMEEFHFDGFRFDGVGSMLYFHHGLEATDTPEKFFKDGVELDAITYLQLANQLIHNTNPKALSIAEDVSGMPGLTAPIEDGGIGFDFRLAMAIPDFWIRLIKNFKDEEWNLDEIWNVLNDRKKGERLVCYSESHDQALVGDKTLIFRLIDKQMYSSMSKHTPDLIVDRGIALVKIIRILTLSLGGQAFLNFMGNEFGHPEWIDFPREGNNWSYSYSRRQWSLAKNKDLKYSCLLQFEKDLLTLVQKHNILNDSWGYKIHQDNENKTLIYTKGDLLFVVNLHPDHSIIDYKFPAPKAGKYLLVFNSDDEIYGGFDRIKSKEYFTKPNKKSETHELSIYNINRSILIFRNTDTK